MFAAAVLLAASHAFGQVGLPTYPADLFTMTPAQPTVLALSAVKNANYKKGASLPAAGSKGTITFVLARGKRAYATIAEGPKDTPRFYNLRGLFSKDQWTTLQGTSCKVSLSANVFDHPGSKVNVGEGNAAFSMAVRDLMRAAAEAAVPFRIGEREYRVAVYDELWDDQGVGKLDTQKLNLAIFMKDGRDHRIDLVELEQIAVGKMSIRPLLAKDRIGIVRLDADRLALFPNP